MKKSRRCKNSRARDEREAADININNQVTRRNLSEKASMAGSKSTPRFYLLKRSSTRHKTQVRNIRNGSTARPTLRFCSDNFLISEQDADMSSCVSHCGSSWT